MEKKLIEFIENYGGVAPLVLTTDFAEKPSNDGHKWVRSMDDVSRVDDLMYWCAWCGVHRVEVSDWMGNPECPAVAAAKELRSLIR